MKTFTKLLLSAVATFSVAGSLASCGKKADDDIAQKGRLSIVYYPGGYGTDYLDELCKSFLAKKKGTTKDKITAGVDYILYPDSQITYNADYWLTDPNKCPDLIISNLLQPASVQNGLVYALDDVFETKVQTATGQQKISDFALNACYEQYSFQVKGDPSKKYYKFAMPWTAIPLSIAYNETLLKSIPHTATTYKMGSDIQVGGNWNRAPETYEELLAYFNDIDAYNTQSGKNVIKFGWAGRNGTNWFEPLITTWWAQRQGVDTPNQYKDQGSYYDFWIYKTEEIFKQTGIQDALNAIKGLIIKDGQFVNSFPTATSMTIKDAQQTFAQGNVALCLTGDFFENEYRSFIETSGQTFKMMRVPSIEGAETKTGGEVKKLTYINISNCAYVPKNGANPDLGKEFLVYSSSEESCMTMTSMTGAIRPFNYDARNYASQYQFSDWQNSIFDLYYGADDLIMKYPRNIEASEISPVYRLESVSNSIFVWKDYYTVISSLRNVDPAYFMVGDPNDSIYKHACDQFDIWRDRYPSLPRKN